MMLFHYITFCFYVFASFSQQKKSPVSALLALSQRSLYIFRSFKSSIDHHKPGGITKRIVVFVAILLFAVNALANTFLKVNIKSGENVINVKIKNETDIDIHKLKLAFDRTKLPQGIKISKSSDQIDVKAKTLIKKSFRLKITASEQIKPGTFVIPFSLKDLSGHSWSFKLNAIINKPNQYGLLQNYPNPFNGQTKITYSLAHEGAAELAELIVFDLQGRLVRSLVKKRQSAGTYKITWDGRDESGNQVSSGIYVYQIKSGTFCQARKLTLLK